MGLPQRKMALTYADYLAIEATSEERHEFHDGEMFAMAGGTPVHARLIGKITEGLGRALDGCPCLMQSSAQRVRLATDHAVYPDAMVVCPPLVRSPDDPDAIVNPVVVVEVLSKSTEAYDRGEKFHLYRDTASIQHIVFVVQEYWSVEHYRRMPDGAWRFSTHGPGDTVDLDAVGAKVSVDDIYDRIEDFGGPARDVRYVLPSNPAAGFFAAD